MEKPRKELIGFDFLILLKSCYNLIMLHFEINSRLSIFGLPE